MSNRDLDKETKSKTTKEEMDKMMKKFLANGGKIEKLKPGMAQNVGSLDKSKKPRYTRHEIESGFTRGEYEIEQPYRKPNTYHDLDEKGFLKSDKEVK